MIGQAGTAPTMAIPITAKSSTADNRIRPSTSRESAVAEMENGSQGRCIARGRGSRDCSAPRHALASGKRIAGREFEENSSSVASPLFPPTKAESVAACAMDRSWINIHSLSPRRERCESDRNCMPACPKESAQATRPVPSTRTRGLARSNRKKTCWPANNEATACTAIPASPRLRRIPPLD